MRASGSTCSRRHLSAALTHHGLLPATDTPFQDGGDDEVDSIAMAVEDYVTERLHHRLFAPSVRLAILCLFRRCALVVCCGRALIHAQSLALWPRPLPWTSVPLLSYIPWAIPSMPDAGLCVPCIPRAARCSKSSPQSTDDEARDLALQTRIRQLLWVTPAHLDSRAPQTALSTTYDDALQQLMVMGAAHSANSKLACIVESCKAVVSALERQGRGQRQSGPSADDLLPVFIYVLLQANPPRLRSNLEFISRFCNPRRLTSGETGYFFVHASGAVRFIEEMDGERLDMSEDEFRARLSGTFHALQRSDTDRASSSTMLEETLRRLAALEGQHVRLQASVDALVADVDALYGSQEEAKGVPQE